ncbi:hypothetical protein HW555_008851 [Spodoptera exigua]|uniref:Gustatory receptor n=1 Tax=Spodoptera exigua TaxID=7107 RepID=A0A835GBT6_SPOEX|nr:hypothetical protein HW555_008851 [Spodoptera exigua]
MDSEAEAKLIKDFLRVIKKDPLKIKLLAKVPLGTHILPLQLTLIDVQRRLGTSNIVYSLIYHMSATITLLFAGQKLQNEFNSFNKALALLACEVSSHHAKSETRQLKDLNRLVTTNPIVIKFSTFSLGMYLFPMMLSLSATYIVVMLQFNHMLFSLFISSIQLVTDHIVFSMVGAYVFLYAIFSAYFVIFAGQHLLNENAVIKKSVATLYSTWSTRPQAPETKRLRNLNKLVNVNPIQIEYTNKIVLGMYLVPIIMSLSASYVIVGLQFNHEPYKSNIENEANQESISPSEL